VYKALDSVGLKREHAYRYPHEFSGGQRQRIVIARALINKPKIIIADEPISALDVSIQAQIINILQDLCKKQNVTILFIAHDLSMVNYACNNVIIMHRGRILEKGNVKKIFENPIHPYTKSLMKATPKLSRVHVDLAAFNENFTYDKEWDAFNKPKFIKINNDQDHQVFGTESQISKWKDIKYKDE
ncbi:MAG: ABC transporter ATP-binding protein, partial [Malacoplasma sp.]|nr:ABC transporter ATP-binding protein [Malacoplasma sp.]